MAILRQIAQLGQPVLRGVAEKIADPGNPALQALIEDLLVTVADANGVGIAAPQVFQHEFDHVQGMVFIDRLESTRDLVTEKEYVRSLQSHA